MHTSKNRIRNLPPQPTSFVGRQDELSEIIQLLADSNCRLLTLAGPGGIGKTRLAVEAAARIPFELKNGIFFIPLQLVQRSNDLVYALADGLHFPLTEKDQSGEQLIDFLGSREALLVLDDFENVLSAESIKLVIQLLDHAPGLKFLVTSREVLNLQEEWIYTVQGLPVPVGPGIGELEASSAAQLFIERARQVRREFSPFDEADSLKRICQITEGMPLALELAASWAKTMNCSAIAEEIEHNIDFLAARMRNIPERHRSIQAVFAYSWERLSGKEQAAFKKLSVFRGGFQQEAAARIANTTLQVLTDLVDKSLLGWDTGRYSIHKLLCQFGEGKLQESPDETHHVRNAFSEYYLDFVNHRTPMLMAGRQRETALEIEAELENIRAAWNWIVQMGPIKGIGQFAMTMSLFYQYQSRFLEGLAMLQKCAELLENQPASQQRDLSLASLQCDISWLLIPLGELDGAEKSALASYAFVQQYRMLPSEAQGFHPLLPLGIITSIRGDYKTAIRHAETVRQESETQSPPWNQQLAYYLLTTTSRHLGDIHAAQEYAQKTYDLAERNQDHWFMGYCLNELGNVASDKGDSSAARGYYQASYNLRRAIDDPGGMAAALTNLGKIELLDSDFPQAKEHFQTAEEIYQEVNDRGGLATSIFGIAQVAAAQGDFQTAEPLLKQALEIAISIPYYSQCTAILGYIGQLLFGSGETQLAAEILNLVLNHPASERNTKDQAHQLLSTVMWSHPKDELDINEVIMGLLAQFPSLDVAGFAHAVRSSQAQDLIDPLTGRELEVLGLIENGLTNHQIGEKLFISPGTAKWYASQIYRKLGVKNRTQAVARARKLNLIGK